MVAVSSPQDSGERLRFEKFSDGNLACVRFNGSIDEAFDGKKLAGTLKAQKLVLDLGGVTRISSFGIREWIAFMGAIEKTVPVSYLIRCPPKVMAQVNMVANFVGRSQVFSFYAPYRCEDCERDQIVLLSVEADAEFISKAQAPDRGCPTCGNSMVFDDDPVGYFSYVSRQRPVTLDGQLAVFLISRLEYEISEFGRRLQVSKHLEGRFTLLRIVGNLDGTFPASKVAEGIEGVVVVDVSGVGGIQPAGAAEFRKFLSAVAPCVERLHLTGCLPPFLLRCGRPDELGTNVEILSCGLPYSCMRCSTTATQEVSVAEHHELLKLSMPPTKKCESCGGATACSAGPDLLAILPTLPKPTATPELVRFLKRAAKRQLKEKDAQKDAQKGPRSSSAVVLGLGLAFMAAAGGAAVALRAGGDSASSTAPAPPKRPAWISSTTPASGYCTDLSNRTVCVGISSYQPSKELGREEASNAALDALANALELRIDNPTFRERVRTVYSDARRSALRELDAAEVDPSSDAYLRALVNAQAARKLVAEALQTTHDDGVPAQASEWYWEEYQASGSGTEFLVYVRFDIGEATTQAIVHRYSKVEEILGAKFLTVAPSLAWKYPDVRGGAQVVALPPASQAAKMGIAEGDIILRVGAAKVLDAPSLLQLLALESSKARAENRPLDLAVKTGDAPVRQISVPPPVE